MAQTNQIISNSLPVPSGCQHVTFVRTPKTIAGPSWRGDILCLLVLFLKGGSKHCGNIANVCQSMEGFLHSFNLLTPPLEHALRYMQCRTPESRLAKVAGGVPHAGMGMLAGSELD